MERTGLFDKFPRPCKHCFGFFRPVISDGAPREIKELKASCDDCKLDLLGEEIMLRNEEEGIALEERGLLFVTSRNIDREHLAVRIRHSNGNLSKMLLADKEMVESRPIGDGFQTYVRVKLVDEIDDIAIVCIPNRITESGHAIICIEAKRLLLIGEHPNVSS